MKKIQITQIIIFILVFLGLSVASFAMPDATRSETENRSLAQVPKISWRLIKSGDFQEDLEEYLKDQLFLRDSLMASRTVALKSLGKREMSGAYIGSKGVYFEKITDEDVNSKLFNKNLGYNLDFFTFSASKIQKNNVYLIIVPTSQLALKNNLPSNAPYFNQQELLTQIRETFADYNCIDATDLVGDNFYHTDHHWKSQGALNVADEYLKDLGFEKASDRGSLITVTEDFLGTLHSKVLDPFAKADSIEAFSFDTDSVTSVTIDGKAVPGIFFPEKLSSKDKYQYFFGGNYGEIIIKSKSTSGRKLLLIKDSFANCFVPALTEDFSEIKMVDLRYFEGSLRSQVENYTDVLVLYNISNYITDRNFFRMEE